MAIPVRTPAEIGAIARAGRALWAVLDAAAAACRPGVTTREIDLLVDRLIREAGATPILRGRRARRAPPFPASCSICINEEVGAGLPGDRILRPGDIVSLDSALALDGWCADAARCIVLDPAPALRNALTDAARRVVHAAAAQMRPGRPWSEIAAQARAEAGRLGFRILPGFGGHGIGRDLHEPPAALFDEFLSSGRRGPDGQDLILRPGMVLTVEPILVAPGSDPAPGVVETGDGWTLLTSDRSDAAHEERTVAITRRGPVVLTGPGGG